MTIVHYHSILDNWALLWAQRMAIKQEVPLYVTFCLPSSYLDATIRQYNFIIEGLKSVEEVSPLSIFESQVSIFEL